MAVSLHVSLSIALLLSAVAPAYAQQSTLPAIADSPTAQALYEDALAQTKENPSEAARLARRLLDEYGAKVLRVGDEADGLFRSVSDETERFLLASPEVLARFREMESAAAEGMLNDEGMYATAARRRLTHAGLVATLRAAQDSLQSDRAAQALAMLAHVAEHPDLRGADAVGYYAFVAAAAARLGLDSVRDEALAQLAALSAQGFAGAQQAAASVRATVKGDAGDTARSPLTLGSAVETPAAEWSQVWSLELENTLYHRLYDAPIARIDPRGAESMLAQARLMTAIPVVLGNRVYVNEGEFVRAIDVDSRDEVWSRALGLGGMERSTGTVCDVSGIAVDHGALVTYEGHAFVNMRNAPSRVWCLDPDNGALRWNANLDGLEGRDELAGLFPVGSPILLPDVVVISARKPTARLEQVDWLLGLAREDGHLLWATSIAGAPGTRTVAGRRHAGVTSDSEAIIVSTPLGVVARVRSHDGAIEWLRRTPIPMADGRFVAEPWEMHAPVVSGDRVITMSSDETEVVALDRRSGQLLEARPIGPGTAWSSPRYLMYCETSDGSPLVLAVGSDIAAFHPSDLSKRLWLFSEVIRDLDPARAGLDLRNGIRGRVSAARGLLLIPGVQELMVLNAADGAILSRISEQRPCNALMLPDRVVTVGDESARVLMPPTRAEAILRARLAASPDDPAAAIALFELAQRTARYGIALESAQAAQRAFVAGKGSDALREELLEHLIALAAANTESGDAAYAIIGAIANTVRLRVRGEFARGDFLRSAGRFSESADVWRALAADETLTAELYESAGVRRSVRIEALRRIAQLSSRDRELVDALEARASEQLAALLATAPPAQRLLQFAMEFPRTSASVEACRAAAKSLTPAQAHAALAAVLDECLIPPARVELCDTLRDALIAMVDEAERAGAAACVNRRVGQLLAASGIERAESTARAVRYPRLGSTPGKSLDMHGRVARFDGHALDQRDPSLLLGILERSLVRLQATETSPPTLEPAWRLRLDDRDPVVLWARDRIVLWQAAVSIGESAMIVDPASGVVQYSTPKPSSLWLDLAQTGAEENAAAGGMIVGPDGDAFIPSQLLPSCDGESLVLVRRSGHLARFGVADALPNPVTARAELSRIYTASLYDGLLTVAGRAVVGDSPTATVAVFDARTLEQRARFETATGEDVRWAFATTLGEVFVGTMSGIERWTIDTAGVPHVVLATTGARTVASDMPTLLGGNLLIAASDDRPTLLPLFDGEVRTIDFPNPVVGAPPNGNTHVLRGMIPVPEGVIIHAVDRLMLLAPSGEIAGVDTSTRERNFAFALPTEQGLLQIDGLGARQVAAGDGAIRVEFPYILQNLSRRHGLRIEGSALELRVSGQRVDRALTCDGWLLVSSNFGLTAVALSESSESSPP